MLKDVGDLNTYEGRAQFLAENWGEVVDLCRSAVFVGTKLTVPEALSVMAEVVATAADEFHFRYDPAKGLSPKNFFYQRAAWRATDLLRSKMQERDVEFTTDFEHTAQEDLDVEDRLLRDDLSATRLDDIEFMVDLRSMARELSAEARQFLALVLFDRATTRQAAADMGLRRPDGRGRYLGRATEAVIEEIREKFREVMSAD